jgi:hypothetical protein
MHRVHGHHLQSRELFARAHQTDFGGERGTRPACKQQRRHHRPQLTHQAQGHQQAQGLG